MKKNSIGINQSKKKESGSMINNSYRYRNDPCEITDYRGFLGKISAKSSHQVRLYLLKRCFPDPGQIDLMLWFYLN